LALRSSGQYLPGLQDHPETRFAMVIAPSIVDVPNR
jgi:hypothetical protein